MKASSALFLPLCLLLLGTVRVASLAQQVNIPDILPLQNADVLKMVQAKMPSDAIVATIMNSRCNFDIFPAVLAELKYRGVPGEVLTAMVEASDSKMPRPERPTSSTPLATKVVSAPATNRAPVVAINKAPGTQAVNKPETLASSPPRASSPAARKLITASQLVAIQEVAADKVRLFPEKFEGQVLKLKGWVGYLKRDKDVVLVKFLANTGNEFPAATSPGQLTVALPIPMAEDLEDFYEKTSANKTTNRPANVTGYCVKMMEKSSSGATPVYYLYTLRLALLDRHGKDVKVILDNEFVDREK
jgi:hypothetical protein